MENSPNKNFAAYRRYKKWQQRKLAEIIGKNQATVSKYEDGSYDIPQEIVTLLHDNFGYSYDFHYNSTGPMELKENIFTSDSKDVYSLINILQSQIDELKLKLDLLEKNQQLDIKPEPIKLKDKSKHIKNKTPEKKDVLTKFEFKSTMDASEILKNKRSGDLREAAEILGIKHSYAIVIIQRPNSKKYELLLATLERLINARHILNNNNILS